MGKVTVSALADRVDGIENSISELTAAVTALVEKPVSDYETAPRPELDLAPGQVVITKLVGNEDGSVYFSYKLGFANRVAGSWGKWNTEYRNEGKPPFMKYTEHRAVVMAGLLAHAKEHGYERLAADLSQFVREPKDL